MNLNIFSPKLQLLYSTIALTGTSLILATSALAQITPDNTLPRNSSVESQGKIDQITGGTNKGDNLFHSFSQFSVKNGRTAYFENSITIKNIFSRVTGNSLSKIDGIIKANGTANLFLLNPSGIIFTENASLDIGGSFIGSTANSIQFADGKQFSAVNPESQPLLSVNLPTALQFGTMPSPIEVQGQGHTRKINKQSTQTLKVMSEESLEVNPEQTLALIGGEILLNGGALEAKGGRIELGSLQGKGSVTLTTVNNGWTSGYENIEKFQDITLDNAALINTTGSSSGDIHLQGKNIALRNGSEILANNNGAKDGGQVIINASESVELIGFLKKRLFVDRIQPDTREKLFSSITAEINGTGKGSNVYINANRLFLANGTGISSGTFDKGDAADITVNAKSVIATEERSELLLTGLSSQTESIGKGGTIAINTETLTLEGGAQISADSFNKGKAGDILVNASKEVTFVRDSWGYSSGLFANSEGTGGGGSITVNTPNLSLQDGAQISTTSFAQGHAGDIIINASKSVKIFSPNAEDNNFPSGLFSDNFGMSKGGNISMNTSNLNINTRSQIRTTTYGSKLGGTITINASESLKLDASGSKKNTSINAAAISDVDNPEMIGTGNGGSIKIISPKVTVRNRAEINVSNFKDTDPFGTGKPGDITIETNNLKLDRGSIRATAYLEDGGNINLYVSDLTNLKKGSISATAGKAEEFGNGGNINLFSQFIVSDSSKITTQAFKGDGGGINLGKPDGIFYDNKTIISTSSVLGLQGEINIQPPDINPTQGLVDRQNITPPSQIATGCNIAEGIATGSFSITGKGGIPALPTDDFQGNTLWDDFRPLPSTTTGDVNVNIPPDKPVAKPIVEAQGWQWKNNQRDTVIFISNPVQVKPQSSSSASIYCKS